MDSRPVKAGRARLDLLKLAAAKLNEFLINLQQRSTSDATKNASDDVPETADAEQPGLRDVSTNRS